VTTNGRILVALPALVVLLLPSLSFGIQLGEEKPGSLLSGATMNISETFYYKFNLFLDDDEDDGVEPPFAFHEFVNRTHVDIRFGRFTFGGQFDLVAATPNCNVDSFVAAYSERYGDGASCVAPNVVLGDGWTGSLRDEAILLRPEKVFFRYKSRNVDFELGDFYAAFGRGITLSFVKRPEVDSDNSLLGGRFDLRTKPMDLTVLAGFTNPQEVSMELRNRGIDKVESSLIAGANLLFRPHSNVLFSTHGLGYHLTDTPSWAFGGTLAVNGIGDALDLFAEADGFFYGYEVLASAETAGEPLRGYAIYGSATAYIGSMTLLIEAKRYKDTQRLIRPGPIVPLQYTQAPTLEHEASITEDINGSVQSNDITGWRAQAEWWWLATDTTLTFSFANAFDAESHPPFSTGREITLHPTVAIDQPLHFEKFDLHLRGDAGYRHDLPWSEEEAEGFEKNTGMLHFRADIGVSFGKHAFELVTTYRRHHFTLENEDCWERGGKEHCDKDDGWVSTENALSWTYAGKLTLALHLDFTDDPIVQSLQNGGAVGNLWYDPDFRASAYVGGEVIWRPTSDLELYLFGGSQKSGIVCTGGACRTVPSFTGVKTRVTVNF
jgi:hypothetical protein